MKKIIAYFTFCLIFIGCSKESTLVDKSTEINFKALAQINNMDINNQIIAYRLLNSSEKLEIWRSKLLKWKKEENITKEQSELIDNLLRNLSHEVFEKGTQKNIYFTETFSKEWKDKAFIIFGHETTYKMTETIRGRANSNIKMLIKDESVLSRLAKPDCACRSDCGSRYCDCRDSNGACGETSFGCGFLWLFSCTGWCFCGGA